MAHCGIRQLVLHRDRGVSAVTTPGSALDQRLQRYKDGLFAHAEIVDIGHVLTGIEGSPKQEPAKDQSLPAPPATRTHRHLGWRSWERAPKLYAGFYHRRRRVRAD